jgi:predicted NAD/FAD-binding protein
VLREIDYTHPLYTFEAIQSQPSLAALNGKNNTYFCGSYFGYGFHEDAVRSGVAVAESMGLAL